MKHVLTLVAIACAIFVFSGIAAAQNPIQLSLFPPVQIVPSTETIKGIQLGLINPIKSGGFMPIFPIVNWGGL